MFFVAHSDDTSVASQSADDFVSLSEDSAGFAAATSGVRASTFQTGAFSSYLSLTQEINASQDIEETPMDDCVKEVLETLLDHVSRSCDIHTVNDVVRDVVDGMVALVIQEIASDEETVKNVLDDMIMEVEKQILDQELLEGNT